jgi:acyl carrier protein
MSSQEIQETVIAAIRKNGRLGSVPITLDTTFEELKLESLAIICTVFDLEADFNIEIPDDAAKNMRSVRDVVDGIASLIATTRSQSAQGQA